MLQGVRFLAQNRHARFHIGRLQLRGQSPFETRNQPMLEIRNLGGRAIARKHDLFMPVEERVEGVEKFFLRALLAAEELDVVDQEQIGLPIAFAEFHQLVVLDRVDEFVDEKLARKIHDLRVFLFRPDVLADRLHQMRLAEPDAAVNEERVVGSGRRLRDGETRGVRDLVVRPDDERFETVARIEPERAAGFAWRRGRSRGADSLPGSREHIFFVRSLPDGDENFTVARRAESGDDRRLQRRHVITFDPELVDVVRNAKGERVVRRLDELNGGKPALESVGADLWFEGGRQFLPELSTLLVHADLLTGLNNPQCERDTEAKFARRNAMSTSVASTDSVEASVQEEIL